MKKFILWSIAAVGAAVVTAMVLNKESGEDDSIALVESEALVLARKEFEAEVEEASLDLKDGQWYAGQITDSEESLRTLERVEETYNERVRKAEIAFENKKLTLLGKEANTNPT